MPTSASLHALPVLPGQEGTHAEQGERAEKPWFKFNWILRESTTGFSDLFKCLPDKFPILLDEDSGIICEPVFLWLYDYKLDNSTTDVKNTLWAYANDAKQWFMFLEAAKKSWITATKADLNKYCEVMRGIKSPETEETYATNTINRRRISVIQFYKWAKTQLGIKVKGLVVNNLLHLGCRLKSKFEKNPTDQHLISVMLPLEARALRVQLGKAPSELKEMFLELSSNGQKIFTKSDVKVSSRDRLHVEIALLTGLRIQEVTRLKITQFARFHGREISETQMYGIEKVLRKGGNRATVDFPGMLLLQILDYIDFERNYLKTRFGGSSTLLFLNPSNAGKFAGMPTSARTIERAFHAACVAAKLVKSTLHTIPVNDAGGNVVTPANTAFVMVDAPTFVYHDLRHTFAVWTYHTKRKSESNPWLSVQKALGHKHLSTTINTYLRFTGWFENEVTDRYMESLNGTTW